MTELLGYEKAQFYDDMHSHFYEHFNEVPGCEMCILLYLYRNHKRTPKEWNPPRDELGRLTSTDEYIKGLQS